MLLSPLSTSISMTFLPARASGPPVKNVVSLLSGNFDYSSLHLNSLVQVLVETTTTAAHRCIESVGSRRALTRAQSSTTWERHIAAKHKTACTKAFNANTCSVRHWHYTLSAQTLFSASNQLIGISVLRLPLSSTVWRTITIS
ncbi:hypothetical protein B0H15DRAFT_513545 [Mycena belliarum]|uniref:Uncharacterized protein n=1 Tax=Mycena belliarum TaxID=1033014 RepID=A0AAD6XSL2_9AGAR|nr:hypothetical protein B0H15DRAFT_513545 [Mycena belliae]